MKLIEFSNKRILIVEDEESMITALSDEIRLAGFAEPLVARNGEDGLKLAIQEHPDLLLVDILLPKMDGIAMAKKLREDTWGKTAKIIILTNFDTTDTMLRNIALVEPSFYLLKSSWGMDAIVIKIKEVLNLI